MTGAREHTATPVISSRTLAHLSDRFLCVPDQQQQTIGTNSECLSQQLLSSPPFSSSPFFFASTTTFSPICEVGDRATFESRPKFEAQNRVIQNIAAGVLPVAGPRHTVSKSTVSRCKTLSERLENARRPLFAKFHHKWCGVAAYRDLGAFSDESEILENVNTCFLVSLFSRLRRKKIREK